MSFTHRFSLPRTITFTAGSSQRGFGDSLFVSDETGTNGFVLRRIDIATTEVTSIAGSVISNPMPSPLPPGGTTPALSTMLGLITDIAYSFVDDTIWLTQNGRVSTVLSLTQTPTMSPVPGLASLSPTAAPTLEVFSAIYIEKDKLRVEEDMPPWARGGLTDITSSDTFFIQNVVGSLPVRVNCTLDGAEENGLLFEAVGANSDGVIFLEGADPTVWECAMLNESYFGVFCNGGQVRSLSLRSQSLPTPAQCSSFNNLMDVGIFTRDDFNTERGFACPFPCYVMGDGGCRSQDEEGASIPGSNSTVGVFRISGGYNLNTSQNIREFNVVCDLAVRGIDPVEVSIPLSLINKAWPAVSDFLIEETDGSFQSAIQQASIYFITANRADRIMATASLSQNGILGPRDHNGGLTCPEIRVGGVEAVVESCSMNNVTFTAPPIEAVCPDFLPGYDCGFRGLEIVNPDGYFGPGSVGGILQCPGPCTLQGSGLFYSDSCDRTSDLDFESTNFCGDLTLDHSRCAFGGGDNCVRCDPNAFCPGGFRMWPRRGYWTATESTGRVLRCPPPATTRCLGWDMDNSRPLCGAGYSGDLCVSCADGFFEQLNECTRCPDQAAGAIAISVLILIAFVLFFMVYSSVHFSPIGKGNTPENKLSKRQRKELVKWLAKDFVIWSLLLLQLFSISIFTQGANSQAFAAVFSWLRIVSLNIEAIGPECYTEGGLFAREYVIFSLVIVAISVTVCLNKRIFLNLRKILAKCKVKIGEKTEKSLRGIMYTFLIFSYTPSTFIAISSVYCVPPNSLDESETPVMWANPSIECLGPQHTPLFLLSIAVLILHSIGFPFWSFFKLRSVFRKDEVKQINKLKAVHYKKFFGDDYVPEYYWVLHCQQLTSFVLCCTRVFLSAYEEKDQLAKLLLNIFAAGGYITLLATLRPHVRHMEWKLPVQISIFILVILSSILEYLNFLLEEKGNVSREAVEGVSIFVLILALGVFLILFASFYRVVYRRNSSDYVKHFLLQKDGTLHVSRVLSRAHTRANSHAPSRAHSPGPSRIFTAAATSTDYKLSSPSRSTAFVSRSRANSGGKGIEHPSHTPSSTMSLILGRHSDNPSLSTNDSSIIKNARESCSVTKYSDKKTYTFPASPIPSTRRTNSLRKASFSSSLQLNALKNNSERGRNADQSKSHHHHHNWSSSAVGETLRHDSTFRPLGSMNASNVSSSMASRGNPNSASSINPISMLPTNISSGEAAANQMTTNPPLATEGPNVSIKSSATLPALSRRQTSFSVSVRAHDTHHGRRLTDSDPTEPSEETLSLADDWANTKERF